MCTEDIPRQERAADNYMKQSAHLDSKVMSAWNKWDESRKKLHQLCNQALSECPDLADVVESVQLRSELRHSKARDDLRHKLLSIENEEINMFTEYMSEMPSMLKKLFLTLKGYDKAPPALTAEYLEVMKKAKSAKCITWSDKEVETDSQFKFISSLDINEPSTTKEYSFTKKYDGNSTADIVTDSEDLTDVENQEPVRVATKRKGTPIKLANNETIIINDSFESMDTTRNLNSAKKIKREFEMTSDVENYGVLDPKDLNSTFVLAGKMDALKKHIKMEPVKMELPKRGLTDRTNTMNPRTITFNSDNGKWNAQYFFVFEINTSLFGYR